MQAIGWWLTCVLLAIAFPKNALFASAEDAGFSLKAIETGRAKVTKLFPITRKPHVDPDVQELRKFFDDLFDGTNEVQGSTSRQARTFGHKRIQFMLMPMMYKMGVMMTLLTVLVVISLKGLLIGAILLILKLSTIIGKFSSGWQHPHAAPSWQSQPIHVHVHNSLPSAHSQAYNGWIPETGPGEDEHYYYKG